MTTWRMRIALWIRKATNTNTEYVIPIAFVLQQWLHESFKHTACFVQYYLQPRSKLEGAFMKIRTTLIIY